MAGFAQQLFETYNNFREIKPDCRRIKHSDILPLIEKRNTDIFTISEAGRSYEGREIMLLKAGQGKTNILLWSQMHGNESTATQALFDIFNFLENPLKFRQETNDLLKHCTLYFIPMLNPDGAEKFQRRNSQEIDINRDALRLEAPESLLLMNLRDKIKAEFGFNLHDQDNWYAVGETNKPASLSFLAPSYNENKDIDQSRKQSMQLIVSLNKMLQSFIPGHISKYNDEFMPSAFGDNVQKKGTSTILLESGAYYKDPEKQFIRKLNFISILYALKAIGTRSFESENIENYHLIPFNRKNKLFDYLLRNVLIAGKHGQYKADIGIRIKALPDKDQFVTEDIGDLSNYFGYAEKDLKGIQTNELKIGDNAEALINKFF